MKVAVFGKNKEEIIPILITRGLSVVEGDTVPDFVASYGGDGTLMRAETAFPGVPKIALRDSQICKKCSSLPNEVVLDRVLLGEYKIEEMFKLSAQIKGEEITGFNDIVVHNKDPRHAIRYKILVDDKLIHHEIIGDGIVVATPFGSTGYYRSITDSFFETGIGLAFNNSTEQADHMILEEGSRIELSLTRGPAIVYADNHEKMFDMEEGDTVLIEKSKEKAKIVRVE